MSDIARDQWLKYKPVVKTDLINQKITLPVFSYPSGELNACLKFAPALSLQFNAPVQGADIVNAITLEAWCKVNADYASTYLPIYKRAIAGFPNPQWEIGLVGLNPYIRWTKGGVVTEVNFIDNTINAAQWNHLAWSWNGINILLYINGVAVSQTALANPVDALGAGNQMIGYNFITTEKFQGSLNEIRVWDVARTQQEILSAMFAPRNTVAADGVDDHLRFYFKCKDLLIGNQTTDSLNLVALGNKMIINATLDTTDMYPMKYGASFVIAKFPVDLGKKCSFKYPVTVDDPNHSLVVRWTDQEGNPQRRWFYKPSGVDYDESITEYKGDCINDPFDLEIWNIDGNDTVSLAEELELGLSLTSAPTTSIDVAPVVAATLAVDTTLAQNFPLTPFPLAFNTQQTYIIP
jgi:hypothetical protein